MAMAMENPPFVDAFPIKDFFFLVDFPLPSHGFPGLQSDMPTLRQPNIYDVHLSELESDEEYVSIRLFFYLHKWHNPI